MTPQELAKRLLTVLMTDRPRLLRIDDYLHGRHDDPYMPATADEEYKLLARRSITNLMPSAVGTPAQACYVDGFRRGKSRPGEARVAGDASEWKWWQRSGMDSKQAPIYRGAITYGHSFALVEMKAGEPIIKGLSALRTAAVYDDPANDIDPVAALTVSSFPTGKARGKARMWDERFVYEVSWLTLDDIRVGNPKRHQAEGCPVTRFACQVDLEGRTTGVVEPMIPLNNRINQTVFDLLVVQTYGSFKVRYATGMAPPLEQDENGDPILDEHGQPTPVPMDHNARRFLFAEDADVKFGSLDGTPLDGYIAAIEMGVRQFAALTQTPPHHLLGQIANLSAEALTAAETALLRKVAEFQHAFGEGWERVFRICAQMSGDTTASDDFQGEVIWRDMEGKSMGVAADALGKLATNLGIPVQGLWPRVPGVTQNELDSWADLQDDKSAVTTLARARQRTGLAPATPDMSQSRGNLTPKSPAVAA